MRVLVCGDRHWKHVGFMRRVLANWLLPGDVLIEGEAPGADTIAADLASRMTSVTVEPYPADWTRYGNPAGPIRNRQMLNEGKPDWVLAFHDNIGESTGTKDMVAVARKASVPVHVFRSTDDTSKPIIPLTAS